ncbi:MAG: peptide ABC transporter substrate-binding protein [Myxococcales bacterium]|nr:peptide ABC transporter substrate-binding protein [Myxococcales bacterium]
MWSWALALVLLAACRAESEPGYFGTVGRRGGAPNTFYVNNYDEPEHLDPALVSESAGSTLLLELFEPLVGEHPADLHAIQGTAERYDKSDDNRSYRFYLRQNARWSDGRAVVAEDFAWAWRRVLVPETGARQVTMMFALKNGALFHRGELAVLNAEFGGLVKGTPLRSYERTPENLRRAPALVPAEATHKLVGVHRAMPTFTGVAPPASSLTAAGAAASVAGAAASVAPSPEPLFFVPAALLERSDAVLGVRATSEHVLEVELEQPTPYFLELLGYPVFYPVRRDVVERHAGSGEAERWTRPEHIVVNGPFTLARHDFRYEMRLEKNPFYWEKDAIAIERIVVFEVPSAQATLALYKTGELDYLGSNGALPTGSMDRLLGYRDFGRAPWTGTYWYEFNTERPPLDDVRVRQALNLALDKRELIDSVARAGQAPATHFVPELTGSGYAAQVRADKAAGVDPFATRLLGFDAARARALLGEAGFTVRERDGTWMAEGFPPLEVLYNTSEGHRAVAVAVQALWKKHLGVSVTLRNEEWKVMIKNMRDGHFQVARFGWVADYDHPHNFLDTFLSYSQNNMTRWRDEAFDEVMARAAAEPDSKRSIALYRQAEERAVHAMPRMPIYFYTKSWLIKPYVKGFYPNAMNKHPIHWMWLDESWRANPENRPAHVPHELPPPGSYAP